MQFTIPRETQEGCTIWVGHTEMLGYSQQGFSGGRIDAYFYVAGYFHTELACLFHIIVMASSIIYTGELKIDLKFPGDLGMSEKAKKEVVSSHGQCLAHHIVWYLHFMLDIYVDTVQIVIYLLYIIDK